MVPPVRSERDRDALWAALGRGTIDMVATDHAPHTAEAKRGGHLEAATGIIGVQWSVPLLFTEAGRGAISVEALTAAMSTQAARRFGLYPRKGVLQVGSDGDVVVLRSGVPHTLMSEELASKGTAPPFVGRTVDVRVEHTILGGQVVVTDGGLVGPPRGRYLTTPRLTPGAVPSPI
jgi:dihydroorotase